MKCFYHGDADAVALCKSCARGICHDCCAEVGTTVACRGRCEADVESLTDLIARNKSAYGKTSATYLRAGIFSFILGVAFVGIGSSLGHRTPNLFLLILGGIFILYGVTQIFAARRWREK